jgi:hypothetical protein
MCAGYTEALAALVAHSQHHRIIHFNTDPDL